MRYERWNRIEGKQLIEEFKKARCSRDISPTLAKGFGRSPEAVLKKLQRLGSNVVGAKFQMTTTIEQVKNLPNLSQPTPRNEHSRTRWWTCNCMRAHRIIKVLHAVYLCSFTYF